MNRKYSQSLYGTEARKKLLSGASQVNRAVGTTLGARGRNVVISKYHYTKLLHDGVKIAQEINPEDMFEYAGAEIIKQAARRQVEVVGDGTTVTVVLAHAIAHEALKIVESGVNPMSLRNGLERGRDLLVSAIQEHAKPLTTQKEKVQIAYISSQDKTLGDLIGETYHKAGIDGVITVDQAVGPETFIDHYEGVQIDSGYVTEYFITNPRNMTATVNDAYVLVTDYKLNDVYKILPLFKNVVEENKQRNVVVIAPEIEGSVLATLIQNKMKGQVNTLAVKVPTYQQDNILKDLAVVLGATFISKSAGFDLTEATIKEMGHADRITSTKDATVIVGGAGKKEDLEDRIEAIKMQKREEENEFNREKLSERLAKLSGGVYVINVGGQTETEIEEKAERADDAVRATRAAIEGGIVPGGEVIYLPIADILKSKNEDEDYAFRILKNALKKPFEKLVENAGMNSGEQMANLKRKDFGFGVDVTTGKIIDLAENGIVDPALVSIEAIKNAVSVAISIITSDVITVEKEDDKKTNK